MLLSYNLYSNVNFPTGTHNNSITTDNIDKVKYERYPIHPLVNGLSDHNAQIIIINNITVDKHINKTQSIKDLIKRPTCQSAADWVTILGYTHCSAGQEVFPHLYNLNTYSCNHRNLLFYFLNQFNPINPSENLYGATA
jgi:hypothetical protein